MPSATTEVQEALKPVAFLELSDLKTIVMRLPLLKIGAIVVMSPHNLTNTLSSESITGKIKTIRKNSTRTYLYYPQCNHKCKIYGAPD